MIQKVKCKAEVKKHGKTRECDRFLLKIINEQIHLPCPSCKSFAVIRIGASGGLVITHVDKEGEEILCQKA